MPSSRSASRQGSRGHGGGVLTSGLAVVLEEEAPPVDTPSSARRDRQAVVRTATSYFPTEVRWPGVSSAGIALSV